MSVGVGRALISPWPSLPPCPSPHEKTAPSRVAHKLCDDAHATECTFDMFSTRAGARAVSRCPVQHT
jgi:hypothetical protein